MSPTASSRNRSKAKAEHGMSLQVAFNRIRELIVHGQLSPGTWIVEAEMAERLGMSRTPVRSAVQWLQREGYILEYKNASKSRMVVAPLTREDAGELYSIIGHVEGLAGRRVAALPRPRRAEITKQLKLLNGQLQEILTGRSSQSAGIFDIDREFHRTVIQAGAGARLLSLHKAIEPQAERYWRLYASSIINDLHLSIAEHEAIIDAVTGGDAERLERALQKNWENGLVRLERVIEIFGERGSW